MRRILALLAVLLLAPLALAQSNPAPCASTEARQLDFWLGEWDLTWEGGQGTNSITRRFGDCVIEENFHGDMPYGPFRGHSVSVFHAPSGKWRQTWVDDQGSYLAFVGGLDDEGVMRLLGEESTLPDGRTQVSRMSWVNVRDDALDWHWERSFDGGETWQMVWLIHYRRAEDRAGS